MAHQRQLIREAVAAALTGATDAGTRVFETRVVPWRQVELPAIAVFTEDESVSADSRLTAPRELTRTVQVAVVAAVQASDDVDDAMDNIAEQIEAAMHADPYLGDTAGDSILSETVTEITTEGNRPIGWVQLTYSVTYRTYAEAAPDLPAFEAATIRHSLSNSVHEDNQGVDDLTDINQE